MGIGTGNPSAVAAHLAQPVWPCDWCKTTELYLKNLLCKPGLKTSCISCSRAPHQLEKGWWIPHTPWKILKYIQAVEKKVSLDTKTLLRNPELPSTHRMQTCGGHTIAHGLGQTTDPAGLRKDFVTVRHILSKDQESNQQGISRELALSGSSDVPQLHHCRSKANTQQRRCNPSVTQQSSFKSRFLL